MLFLKKIIMSFGVVGVVFLLFACNDDVIPEGYIPENDTGLMFDEPEFTSFYNYAPSVIVDGNKAYAFYCSNKDSNIGGDHIAYREGKKVNSIWYWGEKRIVLGPGDKGSWDQMHVCDPSVIRGEFSYNGENYPWLMSYLGCMTDGNYENAFGFAVSKNPEGPWIRVPEVSPLYNFYELFPGAQDNQEQWGTGQPSIISVDKMGKLLIFYTKHYALEYKWGTVVERWDFSNLENPEMEFSVPVKNDGLLQKDGSPDFITVADFIYDPYRSFFYVGTDVHPFGSLYPANITDTSRVAWMNSSGDAVLGDVFKNNFLLWQDMFLIMKNVTGMGKNTNLGFYRDPYGWLPEKNSLDTAVSCSLATDRDVNGWNLFCTLRLYKVREVLD